MAMAMLQIVKRPLKLMVTTSLAAFLFCGPFYLRKYGKYQLAKETLTHREGIIKNLQGKPTLPRQEQQAREEMIRVVQANRDMWAAKVERYERTRASKLYNFVEKMTK